MKKNRVLIITYYWPPAGGPGVQRVLKFVKYLPKFGWTPIILTVKNGEYPVIDESLKEEIPKECIVYKVKSFELYAIYKFFTNKSKFEKTPTEFKNSSKKETISNFLRINFFIPDGRIGWIPNIINTGKKIIRKYNPEYILCSSPPHSSQIGALILSKITKTKLISDFRDPWVNAFWLKKVRRNKISHKLDRFLERIVLNNSFHNITVSNNIRNYFQQFSSKISVIPNGFDEEDFDKATSSKSNTFNIVYTGNISNTQNPTVIINAVNSLIKSKKINSDDIAITFYGKVSYEQELKQIDKFNLIFFKNYIQHKECINKIVFADLLLLFIPDTEDNKGHLSGKIFEYLRSENTILGIGPTDGEAAEILTKTNCGKMFEYNEENKIMQFIQNKYENKLTDFSPKTVSVDIYSRENQTKQLVEIFENTIDFQQE